MQRIEDGYNEVGPDGLTPEQTFDRDTAELRNFVESQYRCWNDSLRPALHAAGVRVLDYKDLAGEQLGYATDFYQREVDPLLTPVTIDPAHPFPARAEQGAVPCPAAAQQAQTRGRHGARRGHGAARPAPAGAAAVRRKAHRLSIPPRADRGATRRGCTAAMKCWVPPPSA